MTLISLRYICISYLFQGGQPALEFPQIYTDPRLVVGTRNRTYTRWKPAVDYNKYFGSLQTTREEDIRLYHDKLVQPQRQYYSDRTGAKSAVAHFILPTPTDCYRFRKLSKNLNDRVIKANLERFLLLYFYNF